MKLPFVFSLLLVALTSATVFGEPNRDWPHIRVERYRLTDDKTQVQITYLTLWSSREVTDVENGGTLPITDENSRRWGELFNRYIATPNVISTANDIYGKKVFKGEGDATLPGQTTPRQFVEFADQLQVSPPPPDKTSPQPGQSDASTKPSGDQAWGASGSGQPSQPNRKPLRFRRKLEEIRPGEFRKVWDIHSDTDQLSWARVNFDAKARYNLKIVGSEGEYEIFEEVMPQDSKAKDVWGGLIGTYTGDCVGEIVVHKPPTKLAWRGTFKISGTSNSPEVTITASTLSWKQSGGWTKEPGEGWSKSYRDVTFDMEKRRLIFPPRVFSGVTENWWISVEDDGTVLFQRTRSPADTVYEKTILKRVSSN